jgi:[acyl-carrier-protein] S-malonyltransferase
MAPARAELEGVVGGLRPADPSRLLLSNADGAAVDGGAEVLSRLVSQVTSPVRFDLCLATLRDLGVTAAIELPPAGALAGLAKREWKGADVEILALNGPGDLDRARQLIDAERGRAEAEHLPDWRVVVSPVRGTVSPADVTEGTRLPAGTPLGSVRSRREEVNVSAGYDGVLAEWLVHDGDLVDAGDPLARLYPEVSS